MRGEGYSRALDEDVEVEAQRRGAFPSHRTVRCRYGEAVLPLRLPPRKGPRLERTGGRGSVPVPRAGVPPDRPAERGGVPGREDAGRIGRAPGDPRGDPACG